MASPMFRFVIIDKTLIENEYIEVMCHELMHLKYNTINERYVQYQTFVTLFKVNLDKFRLILFIKCGIMNIYMNMIVMRKSAII